MLLVVPPCSRVQSTSEDSRIFLTTQGRGVEEWRGAGRMPISAGSRYHDELIATAVRATETRAGAPMSLSPNRAAQTACLVASADVYDMSLLGCVFGHA